MCKPKMRFPLPMLLIVINGYNCVYHLTLVKSLHHCQFLSLR